MNTTGTKLFQKDFTLVVIGQIISLFGNSVLRFTLPLYLLRETDSAFLFGAVTACSFIPMVVFSLIGGVLADRANKRNIMVGLDFSTAALICAFCFFLGRLPVVPLILWVLMTLYGICGAYQPAVQASIPVLVGGEQILQGNAVINMVNTLSGLLGPVIGGILFGTWGITPVLIVGIICFAASAVMEIFIHIPGQRQQTADGVLITVKNDLTESWTFVKLEKPSLLSVVWVLALFNLVLSSSMVVGIPIMIVQILGMTDAGLGFTQGAMGLGGLAGGALAGAAAHRMKLRHGYWPLLICSFAAAFTGLALLPSIPRFTGYLLITAASFLAMAVSTLFTIQIFTVIQQQTPPHLVGKIMAAIIAAANCAHPVGQAFYGLLFDVCAQVPWLIMLGAGAAALIISLYSKKVFYRLEKES